MKIDNLNQWLTLLANFGVIVGIIFLALEIQTNTETNRIGIQGAYAGNWIEVNTLIAGNSETAAIYEKAIAGEELNDVEHRQFRHIVRLYATQSNLMRRLYEDGIATEDDLRGGYRAFRELAQYDAFRKEIELMSEVSQRILLDEDGLENYINDR